MTGRDRRRNAQLQRGDVRRIRRRRRGRRVDHGQVQGHRGCQGRQGGGDGGSGGDGIRRQGTHRGRAHPRDGRQGASQSAWTTPRSSATAIAPIAGARSSSPGPSSCPGARAAGGDRPCGRDSAPIGCARARASHRRNRKSATFARERREGSGVGTAVEVHRPGRRRGHGRPQGIRRAHAGEDAENMLYAVAEHDVDEFIDLVSQTMRLDAVAGADPR